jgi:hypothetical protein
MPDRYEDLLRHLRRQGMRDIELARPERFGRTAERLGMSAPAVQIGEDRVRQALIQQLAGQRAGFGIEQIKREQQVEDIKRQNMMTREQWREQYRQRVNLQNLQEGARLKLAKLERGWQLQDQQRQERLMKKERERARKSEKRNLVTGLLSTAGNLLTGGLLGGAVASTGLLGKGVTGGQGRTMGLLGGLSGLSGVASQNLLLQPFLQRNAQQLQQPQSPLSQILSNYQPGMIFGQQGLGGQRSLSDILSPIAFGGQPNVASYLQRGSGLPRSVSAFDRRF